MNRDQESVAVPGRYIDCSYVQSVMKNVHGALLYPRQNNLPSQ